MATPLRKTIPVESDLGAAVNSLKGMLGAFSVELTGSITLNGSGQATISNATITPDSVVTFQLQTFGGTALAAGLKSTASAGSIAVQAVASAGGNATTDQSTYRYVVTTPVYHLDKSEVTSTAAAATDLPSSITLIKELMAVYNFHIADTLAHKAADTTNTLANTIASVVDLPSCQTAVNDLKAKFNAHLTQAGVHYLNDSVNSVATANASDLPSTEALANALQTAINAHMGSGAPGASIRLVSA